QHAGRLPPVLRPPGGVRCLPRRLTAGDAERAGRRGAGEVAAPPGPGGGGGAGAVAAAAPARGAGAARRLELPDTTLTSPKRKRGNRNPRLRFGLVRAVAARVLSGSS